MIKKNFFKIVIIAFFMIIINITVSEAAISASSKTVNSGEKVQISVSSNIAVASYKLTVTNNGGLTFITSTGGEGAGTTTITDASTTGKTSLGTFTFQAPTVTVDTKYTVSFNATIMEDINFKPIDDSSTTATITVKAPVVQPPTSNESENSGNNTSNNSRPSNNNQSTETPTKSSNSRLSSLQIAEGVISPEFDSSVREYTINVPNEITKLSIAAVADHSKATVRITGNEELQVGENTIEIIVTAENGSTTTYKILATRELPELNLEKLSIYYINEEGNKIELILDPQFVSNIYEYVVTEKLSNKVEKLEIETTANRENAKIEIVGNNELKAGKNEITIKVTLEDEAGLEEQKTYKITVEREEEPVVATLTTWEKIENWFTGVGSTIGKWVSTNIEKIITGMLIVATATFVGLTIYFAYDYKNYKSLLSKLAELNKTNLMERANIALDPENVEKNINEENIEEVKSGTDKVQEIQQEEKKEVKSGKGKRFK